MRFKVQGRLENPSVIYPGVNRETWDAMNEDQRRTLCTNLKAMYAEEELKVTIDIEPTQECKCDKVIFFLIRASLEEQECFWTDRKQIFINYTSETEFSEKLEANLEEFRKTWRETLIKVQGSAITWERIGCEN